MDTDQNLKAEIRPAEIRTGTQIDWPQECVDGAERESRMARRSLVGAPTIARPGGRETSGWIHLD
jgi:hypothetical protein